MIQIPKLMSLMPAHRQRKAAQTLARIEEAVRQGDVGFVTWLAACGQALAADTVLPPALRILAASLAEAAQTVIARIDQGRDDQAMQNMQKGLHNEELVRAINRLRRSLEAHAGVSPSDWDFADPVGLNLDASARRIFPGVHAYLDDIRSPFNVGSIFRTADAFGVAELLVSPFTADPAHPRAQRSAMGATTVVPWRRASISDVPADFEGIALELRGESLDSFVFPPRGFVFIGSEELGVSPEALERCAHRVSIPMLGAKGSLNVGVAFGVFMNAWRASLAKQGIKAIDCSCRSGSDAL